MTPFGTFQIAAEAFAGTPVTQGPGTFIGELPVNTGNPISLGTVASSSGHNYAF